MIQFHGEQFKAYPVSLDDCLVCPDKEKCPRTLITLISCQGTTIRKNVEVAMQERKKCTNCNWYQRKGTRHGCYYDGKWQRWIVGKQATCDKWTAVNGRYG